MRRGYGRAGAHIYGSRAPEKAIWQVDLGLKEPGGIAR
jgi:hypothetical protein